MMIKKYQNIFLHFLAEKMRAIGDQGGKHDACILFFPDSVKSAIGFVYSCDGE
jgi:hypothetical protein